MGINSYQSINELLAELDRKLTDLNKGNMSLKGLDEGLELVREIHERLIVVRHKARELAVAPAKKPANEYKAPEAKPIVAKEAAPVEAKEEVKEQPAFDFTFSAPVETPEPVVVDAVPTVSKSVQRARKSVLKEKETAEPTLKDKFTEDNATTLRKKLQSKPVSDLTKEIGIGKKFEYISLMFKGNSKAYDEAISSLNSCSDLEQAQQLLGDFSAQHGWNLEDRTVAKFIELVERRYSA
jgi:hypothetical protein